MDSNLTTTSSEQADDQRGPDLMSKGRDAGVTLRAVLIALILIPIDNLWITVTEVRWGALDGSCLPLFITPIFILFVIALLNLAVHKWKPHLALKRGELLTIYIMVVMAAAMAGHDLIQNLFGSIGHAHYMANETNEFQRLFFRYLPKGLLISDPTALNGLYKGGVDPWVWSILRFWIGPLAGWAVLMMILIGMMMCLNIIIRRQWTENEKLVFPLVQLPIAMTAEDSGRKFYTNKLMWGAFAIAFMIGLINGLHALYPTLPYLPGVKQFNVGALMQQQPWNALQTGGCGFQITAYPFAIGIAYFIPLDLSFSCWFFYVAQKLVKVFGAAMGWTVTGQAGFPDYESQSSGAWLALGAIIIIASLPYLRGVWRKAFSRQDNPEDAAEGSLYRKSIYGLILGTMLLLVFSRWIGLAAHYALIFFGIYFILAIAMTRVRAEFGTPHEIYFVNPQQIMVTVLGYHALGPMNLTVISTMYWFNRCYRCHPMPNQLEAFKMAEGTAIKIKPLIFALMLAAFVGLIAAYWANLQVTYADGAQAKCLGFKGVANESLNRLRDSMINEPKPDACRIVYMCVGAAMIFVLKGLRGAFIGWPFHPAGYALAVSYAMDYFWFAFFVSWLIKLLIVRYGGMRLHNMFVPFFLGLILGDFCIGSIWTIVGILIQQQTYKVFI